MLRMYGLLLVLTESQELKSSSDIDIAVDSVRDSAAAKSAKILSTFSPASGMGWEAESPVMQKINVTIGSRRFFFMVFAAIKLIQFRS
jgi:hypothetical protein